MKNLHSLLKPLRFTLILVVLVILVGLSVQVVQPDFGKLFTSASKARAMLSQLFSPELFIREPIGTMELTASVPVPCGSASESQPAASGPRITVEPACAAVKDTITIHGEDLAPDVEVLLHWILPGGQQFSVSTTKIMTDASGSFTHQVEIRPIVAAKDGTPSRLVAVVNNPQTVLKVSDTLKTVGNAMIVTIFMALVATTLGTLFAVPIGFLGASNITRKGVVGTAVYYMARAILNITRSFEPLVMATIFALMVSFGSPFAGVLALTLVTTASLGKMFSEAVESIDRGPIEAVTATGANAIEVVLYAIVPQVMQDFLSFVIYHWDINVRISTIIGFVGGGGIGYYLSQQTNTLQWQKAGTALLAIIIVVWILDFLSAQVRKKLI